MGVRCTSNTVDSIFPSEIPQITDFVGSNITKELYIWGRPHNFVSLSWFNSNSFRIMPVLGGEVVSVTIISKEYNSFKCEMPILNNTMNNILACDVPPSFSVLVTCNTDTKSFCGGVLLLGNRSIEIVADQINGGFATILVSKALEEVLNFSDYVTSLEQVLTLYLVTARFNHTIHLRTITITSIVFYDLQNQVLPFDIGGSFLSFNASDRVYAFPATNKFSIIFSYNNVSSPLQQAIPCIANVSHRDEKLNEENEPNAFANNKTRVFSLSPSPVIISLVDTTDFYIQCLFENFRKSIFPRRAIF